MDHSYNYFDQPGGPEGFDFRGSGDSRSAPNFGRNGDQRQGYGGHEMPRSEYEPSDLHISLSDIPIPIQAPHNEWDEYERRFSTHSGSNSGNSSPLRSSSPQSFVSSGSREYERHNSPALDTMVLPSGLDGHRMGNSAHGIPPYQSEHYSDHYQNSETRNLRSMNSSSPIEDYGYRSGGSLGSNGSFSSHGGGSSGSYGGGSTGSFGGGSYGSGSSRSGNYPQDRGNGHHHRVDPSMYEPQTRSRYSSNEINADYMGYLPRSDVDTAYQQHSQHGYPAQRSRSSGQSRQTHVYDYVMPGAEEPFHHRQGHMHVPQRSNSASPHMSHSGGGGVPVYRQQRTGLPHHAMGASRPVPQHGRPMKQSDPRHHNMGMSAYGPSGQREFQSSRPVVVSGSGGPGGRSSVGEFRRDIELEADIFRNAEAILSETANKCLKSVELANALRDRIGKEALQRTKNLYGGLLVLLELYKDNFVVHRIPKNDMVELITPPSHHYSAPGGSGVYGDSPASFIPSRGPVHIPPYSSGGSAKSAVVGAVGAPPPTHPEPTPGSVPWSQQAPSNSVFISEIPEGVSGTQIWNDFGGQDIVQKVSIEFQGNKKTGVVVFTSINAARAALKSPALAAWKHLLSFSDAGEISAGVSSGTVADKAGEQGKQLGAIGGSQSNISAGGGSPEKATDQSSSDLSKPDVPLETTNSLDDPHNSIAICASTEDDPMFRVSASASSDGDDTFPTDAFANLSSLSVSLTADPAAPPGLEDECATPGGTTRPPLSSRRGFAAPAINTTAEVITAETQQSPSALLSPAMSTPGGTPRLSFTFFDESAEDKATTLSGETLPQSVNDVMGTLCDTLYVPQRPWERNELGDYLFCQVLTEILSTQFGGNFIQMTKLKQQLKRKFGGTIRIGPLKALIVAYPEYFEVDRSVNVVRSLHTVLSPIDISVIANS